MTTPLKAGDRVRINCPASYTHGQEGIVTYSDQMPGGGITVRIKGDTRTYAAANVEPLDCVVLDRTMNAVAEQLTTPLQACDVSDYPRALVQALVDYLGEGLGCDHAVGICTCTTSEVVYELKLALEGRGICSRCGGEGFVDDPEGHPMTCQRCFTSGVVTL